MTYMSGGKVLLDQITMTLKNETTGDLLPVYIDVYDNSLSRKWLNSLNHLIKNDYHLEKNYCFVGFPDSERNAVYICDQINKSIAAINAADLGYTINDHFTVENTIVSLYLGDDQGGGLNHEKFNKLHRYFEDLQGISGRMSDFYNRADSTIRWHIRQLNLLCHEYEALILSLRKKIQFPEWVRPSQLMCWLNAPRFNLELEDYDLFGIESINRPLGGVFVGVNKAIGKHHWEVFVDEARFNPEYKADNLVTSALRSQCEAAGDFDIEWANDPGEFEFQKKYLRDFRTWLINNNIDPEDKSLTIGHPQVGQVDLVRSFGTRNYKDIWKILESCLNVYSIKTTEFYTEYPYKWSDPDFIQRQVAEINKQR